MTGSEHGMRRITRVRWTVAGGVISVIVLGLVGCASPSQRTTSAVSAAEMSRTGWSADPPSGGSAPGAGWAPVPYRDAQLWVPGSWMVESPAQESCGFLPTHGMIFTGTGPILSKGMGCRLTASLAWIVPAGHIPRAIRHRKPTALIHGIPVYRLHSGKGTLLYLVPELKVRVGVRGPKDLRVLGTLTRSPLSVVLRRGLPGSVPAGWAWRRFGGIRFATPRSWTVRRADQWETCGTGVTPATLLLIHATKQSMPLPCPYQPPTASALEAVSGLTVVTGKYAAASVGQEYAHCRVRYGVRICLATITGQSGADSGVLIFSVSRPHQHAGTFVLLGLPGSGARARAIFTSIRLAPSKG